jgi:phage host-nuclease inhibitor protein Gam
MEKMAIEHDKDKQKIIADSHDEANQLRGMIDAMRQEMERIKIQYEDEIAAVHRADRDEMQQLREAIYTLRQKLEGYEKR